MSAAGQAELLLTLTSELVAPGDYDHVAVALPSRVSVLSCTVDDGDEVVGLKLRSERDGFSRAGVTVKAGRAGGTAFHLLEAADGQTLSELLTAVGPLAAGSHLVIHVRNRSAIAKLVRVRLTLALDGSTNAADGSRQPVVIAERAARVAAERSRMPLRAAVLEATVEGVLPPGHVLDLDREGRVVRAFAEGREISPAIAERRVRRVARAHAREPGNDAFAARLRSALKRDRHLLARRATPFRPVARVTTRRPRTRTVRLHAPGPRAGPDDPPPRSRSVHGTGRPARAARSSGRRGEHVRRGPARRGVRR
jgi:hypothetical protein